MANGNNEQQNNSSSSNTTITTEHTGDEPSSVLAVDLRLSGSGDVGGGCARGTLNDLVADLCVNGSNRSSGSGYGDYTNIRATPDRCSATLSTGSVTSAQQPAPSATAASGSSFSFKHFLNSSGTVTAPSTTVTSLDAITTASAASTTSTTTTSATAANAAPSSTLAAAVSSSSLSSTVNPLQSSTGARPKVPQSASASLMPSDASGGNSTSKMKRSPRFSSFDSQASLAEYAAGGAGACRGDLNAGGACGLSVDEDNDDDDVAADVRRGLDFFPSRLTGASSTPSASSSRYVPRSYSSYDMPPPAASPRRRCGISAGNRESRPNRLAFSTNQNANKMKLDLPLDSAASIAGAGCASNATNRTLPTHQPTGGIDYIAAGHPAAAAALPDFVQDHWLDSWYAHDMHLNSPPNSPICEFGDDDLNAGGAAGGVAVGENSACVGGGLPGMDVFGAAIGNLNISGGGGSGGGGSIVGIGGSLLGVGPGGDNSVGGNVGNAAAAKMLPDFLSDGPIIHSSQRLADVAVGLPSNSIGSPQDACTSLQLSTLRLEHERLQRELSEARAELSAQTRRANELERQLQQQQDAVRRRDATAPAATMQRLQKQVTLLKAEVAALHRENESLREAGGAVGGLPTTTTGGVGVATASTNCDRATTCGGTSAANNAAASNNSASNLSRPSRTQQYSRDLLLAAANAENNLRQLLVGVDNLRQIAAGLDNATLTIDYDASPDLYSDFIEDEEEFEDYNGASGGGGGVNN